MWLMLIISIGLAGIAYLLYNVKNLLFISGLQFTRVNVSQENVLFVSDLHISFKDLFRNELDKIGEYMVKKKVKNLFIIGDLFDDFHRKISIKCLSKKLQEALKIMNIPSESRVFITFSASSHDPIIPIEEMEIKLNSMNIIVTSRPICLMIDDEVFYLLHGDFAVKNGALAFLLNKIGEYLGKTAFVERILKKRLKLDNSSWLIIGHTHIPLIDEKLKIANTGCWKQYWRRKSNTAILYQNGRLKLIKI